MQKITPFLWFDTQALEAAEFYCSIFKNAGVLSTTPYPEGSRGQPGSVMTVDFQLEGQRFVAINGGPVFTFTPAISFYVDCATQAEVDTLWEKLTAGGAEEQCGWLKDKYGVSWQIVPTALSEMMTDPDPMKVQRVAQALLQMVKLDIEGLRRAYEQS